MILSSIRSNANTSIASEKFLFSVNHQETAQQLEQLQGHHHTVKNVQNQQTRHSSEFAKGKRAKKKKKVT